MLCQYLHACRRALWNSAGARRLFSQRAPPASISGACMSRRLRAITVVTLTAAGLALTPLLAQPRDTVLKGQAAFGDWRADSPGTRRLIRPQDLPSADLARSARNVVREVRRTAAQKPIVPPG